MEVGVGVWVKNEEDGDWIPSTVVSKVPIDNNENAGFEIGLRDEGGNEVTLTVGEAHQDLDNCKLRNDDVEGGVENLIKLPYLHEPAILHCLEQRYANSDIYTYTGPILIAVNPFKIVPLYTTQVLETYYNLGLLRSQGIESPTELPPHIYAIADAAFRDMMNAIHAGHTGGSSSSSSDKKKNMRESANADQAILVSGESGAGKTESTKIVLRYLTTVGNSSGTMEVSEGSVMDKVLQSNPILEAFGNAKTIRNDNSSRFGKYIDLNFNRRGHLIGGTISTYLLEKVRLPNQQGGERNFHVFYQMMAGATPAEKEAWKLDAPQNFRFTNQGDVYTLQHFDDTKEWESLKKALHVLNFQKSDQIALFDAMAGLLHAGEMGFADDGDEGSVLGESDSVQAALQHTCALLGLKAVELVATLTTRTLVTRGETMVKKCKVPEAKSSLDSLVKAIYGRLFEWIVTSINYCIQVDSSQVRADIGVLDIFGFECFLHNSFEQLCINYTNETLQQQFNQYVFKLEQLEYDKEKIEWSFISFPDNQDCLDLIEHKTQGILAFIDDECRLPRATDEKLVARMHKALESHPRFSFTHKMKRDCQFQIKHYAGPVVYTAHTFCVKNKDELPKEALSLMQNSAVPLLSAIFIVDVVDAKALLPHQRNSVKSPGPPSPRASITVASNGDGGGGGGKGIKDNLVKSVGSAFRTQLASLMEKIFRTKPHYIRCLKPNDQNVPDRFHRIRTVEQLRYGGVLEAVRVARSGFPVRLSHGEFYHRYRPLCNPFHASTKSLPSSSINAITSDGEAFKELNERLLALLWDEEASNLDPETCPALQNKSARKLVELSLWLGKHNITKQSVQLGVTKTFLRKEAHDMLEARRSRRLAAAARIVQAVMRGMPLRRTFLMTVWATNFIQRVVRGHNGRTRAYALRQQKAACCVQSVWRRFWHHRRYLLCLTGTIIIQAHARRRIARRAYREHIYAKHGARLVAVVVTLVTRQRFMKYRRAITTLQNRHRAKLARKDLMKRRKEAKDTDKLKQSNDALKAEIEALKVKAAAESATREKQLQEQARQQALQEAEAQLQEQKQREEVERASAERLLEEERKKREETETLRAQEQLEFSKIVAELTAAKEALDAERLSRESLMQMQASEMQQPQHESDALLAEIAMLSDLLEDERKMRAQVEEELVEALKVCSGERAGRLDAETRLEVLEIHSKLPGSSGNGDGKSPFNAGDQSSIMSPGIEDTWAAVGSMHGSGRNDSSIASEQSPGAGTGLAADFDGEAVVPATGGDGGRGSDNAEDSASGSISPHPSVKEELHRLRKHSMHLSQQNEVLKKENSELQQRQSERHRRETSGGGGVSTPVDISNTNSSSSNNGARSVKFRSGGGRGGTAHSPRPNANRASLKSLVARGPFDEDDEEDDEEDDGDISMEGVQVRLRTPGSSVKSSLRTVRDNENDGEEEEEEELSPEERTKREALLKFSRTLELFHNRMHQGFPVFIWEGAELNHKIEVKMVLSSSNRVVSFEDPKSRRKTFLPAAAAAFFGPRLSVAPIRVVDIFETLPGGDTNALAEGGEEIDDELESSLMTLVTKSEGSRPRTLLVKLTNKEERNNIISGLRMMHSAQTTMSDDLLSIARASVGGSKGATPNLKSSSSSRRASSRYLNEDSRAGGGSPSQSIAVPGSVSVSEGRKSASSGALSAAAATADRTELAGETGGDNNSSSYHAIISSISGGSNEDNRNTARDSSGSGAAGADSAITPISNHRRTRKKTMREEALSQSARRRGSRDNGIAATTPGKGALPIGNDAIEAAIAANGSSSGGGGASAKETQALKVEVARVRSQNLTYINELNERNSEITALKKHEAVLEATLKAKEKMYEQDATVRMQLGRRLEQILLDKEEYKDEIDELKQHILRLEEELVIHQQEQRRGSRANSSSVDGEESNRESVVTASAQPI